MTAHLGERFLNVYFVHQASEWISTQRPAYKNVFSESAGDSPKIQQIRYMGDDDCRGLVQKQQRHDRFVLQLMRRMDKTLRLEDGSGREVE